ARLTLESARRRIDDALGFFDRSSHPFSWWHGPGTTPDSLASLLIEHGLEARDTELLMALDLASLPDRHHPEDLQIRRVTTSRDPAVFAELSAANWSPPDPWVIRYYELARDALLAPTATQWLYLGWLDGWPVATAELTVGGGVVGLYNIATIPAA